MPLLMDFPLPGSIQGALSWSAAAVKDIPSPYTPSAIQKWRLGMGESPVKRFDDFRVEEFCF